MTHPIIDLQTNILALLTADAPLMGLLGANAIVDMPPTGKTGPYMVILRHDLLVRDTDDGPGNDHRIQFRIWNPSPNRSGVLAPAQRVIFVLLEQDLSTATLMVTNVAHQRVDTAIDLKSGRAHATLNFRIFSEPVT